ncbi:MAG TPA: hypothetical protein PKD79_02625 [Candidatus Doudnabacteria bacterium]|mgnify:CR=1 FL=1|nr:hypothetical protein [Candidatus Doudnabacteria bacterium]
MLASLKSLFKPNHKVSDFSSIGFNFEAFEDIYKLGKLATDRGEQIEIPMRGSYYKLSTESGAELWAQISKDNQGIGLHPGFNGECLIKVKAKPFLESSRLSVLDGYYDSWLITDDQDYPLLFESPNFYQTSVSEDEIIVEAQVTAFAKEVKIFSSEEERNKDEIWGLWATQSFTPSGKFSPNDDESFEQHPAAIFSGYIRKIELKRNEITSNKFYHLIVESLSASYDVVIDPSLLISEPQIGNILSGQFYLSGKIISIDY